MCIFSGLMWRTYNIEKVIGSNLSQFYILLKAAFLRLALIVSLTRSHRPFVCEWYGVENVCLIPRVHMTCFITIDVNDVPLSDNISLGKPKIVHNASLIVIESQF